MTVADLKTRLVVSLTVAALLVVFLPVTTVHADERPPESRDAVMDGFEAVAPAAGSLAPAAVDAPIVSEPMEAPFAFTMVGVQGSTPADVAVRVRHTDGTWSDWETVTAMTAEDGPDAGSREAVEAEDHVGSDWVGAPHWVGDATAVQLNLFDGDLDDLEVTVIDSMGLSESRLERFVRQIASRSTVAPAEASSPGRIVTRAQWGADESLSDTAPRYARVRFGVLHHTATSNSYTRAQAPGIVRAIHRYHVVSNGWSDIGYNVLIDRFGTIYEGRAGGLERGVIGAHARNYNTGSFGVSVIGNFERETPPTAALDAVTRVMVWKYGVHGLDARQDRWVSYSGRWIRTLVGHRDVGSTACPGAAFHRWMPTLRQRIESGVVSAASGWTPLVGDWTGDGATSIGWFRNGEWRLHPSSATPGLVQRLHFGAAGDLPVVGDWNGDGVTTVGVVRDGRWFLRFDNSGGLPDADFYYGRGAIDHPMAGDWNGDGFDTPAIVRDGEWHLRDSLTSGPGDRMFTYGRVTRGDVPLVGDWTGDGIDTPAILRDGEWHLRYTHSGGPADRTFVYGRVTRGDRPFVGDWDGNGRLGVGVNRNGMWHLRHSLSGGPAERSALRW